MDTLVNIQTFLSVIDRGSFASAAQSLEVAPSVVSKRIGQLEHQFKATLFQRSTRAMVLTEDGARLLPRFQKLIAEFDDLRDVDQQNEVSGHLRIDAPGTITSRVLGPIFCDFLVQYPNVEIDLRLIDRIDNPLEKGCDLAIGTRPSTFDKVRDVPLMPYTNAVYASADYVAKHGKPEHPTQVTDHGCLVSLLYGTVWHFYGAAGDFAVRVNPRFSVNDTIVLREAVRRGLGIAILPTLLVEEDVKAGRLELLLPDFRPPPMWLKALVPTKNAAKPSVRALLEFLSERLAKDMEVANDYGPQPLPIDDIAGFSPRPE